MTEKKKSVQIFDIKLKEPIHPEDFDIRDYIEGYHDQDCCENVYIDFTHVEKQRGEIDLLWKIDGIELRTAPEEGIIVNLYDKDLPRGKRVSIFLACRNEQNWYYNDQLDVVFKINWLRISTNLNELGCVVSSID